MDIDIEVFPEGRVAWPGRSARCALGRGGVARDKREGDGVTPAGRFPLRRLLYRADRLGRPTTGLPVDRLGPDDGWCDDPLDPRYNRQVRLPYAAHCERLWREDHVYDLVLVIGYNDAPAVPGRGSAIFLHLARPDFSPTEGCVALALPDLLALLAEVGMGDELRVIAP